MPIYEYQCDACTQVFEVFQKHSDPPPSSHSCGSQRVHRILSHTSFRLKGSGWYATDYGQQSGKGGSKKDSDNAAEQGSAKPSGDAQKDTSSNATAEAKTTGAAAKTAAGEASSNKPTQAKDTASQASAGNSSTSSGSAPKGKKGDGSAAA